MIETHAGGLVSMDAGAQHLADFEVGLVLLREAFNHYQGTLSIARLLPRITNMAGWCACHRGWMRVVARYYRDLVGQWNNDAKRHCN